MVVISVLFFYNRDNIRRTIAGNPITEDDTGVIAEPLTPELPVQANERESAGTAPSVSVSEPVAAPTETPGAAVTNTPAATDSGTQPTAAGNEVQSPAVQPQSPSMAPVLRDRVIYLITVDSAGTILRTRINRSLPVTDSPLTDTINALLAGPTPEESRRGLISLIPEGTRIIGATVQGNTAHINFSEDFQFNIYGVEGYVGALRQIVWTATEFSNVQYVQILIEGRRIDYLGEGVWIGSPVTRDMY